MAKHFLDKITKLWKKRTSECSVSNRWLQEFPLDDFPDEILCVILSFCPKRFLLSSAPRVSRKWRDICQGPTLWRMKCERDNVIVPHALPSEYCDFKRLCIKNPFGRNLLKNWDASEDLNHWLLQHDYNDDGVVVEDSITTCSHGSQPLSELNVGTTKCWATSYCLSMLSQTVDLIKEGLTSAIMDDLQPAIQVSVWTAARFDCASSYEIHVSLCNEKGESLEGDCKFNEVRTIRQWDDSSWAQITHAFCGYGRGVRKVQFSHGGKDNQFWAGHFGPKLAAPSLTVDIEEKLEH